MGSEVVVAAIIVPNGRGAQRALEIAIFLAWALEIVTFLA
jgi:hypothetical protein